MHCRLYRPTVSLIGCVGIVLASGGALQIKLITIRAVIIEVSSIDDTFKVSISVSPKVLENDCQ